MFDFADLMDVIDKSVILAIISGIGASLITFLSSTFLSLYLSIRETKKTNRAFISLEEQVVRYDGYPLSKDSAIKIIETKDFSKLFKEITQQEKMGTTPKIKVTFAQIKNLGPATAIQLQIGFRLILTDSTDVDGWREGRC